MSKMEKNRTECGIRTKNRTHHGLHGALNKINKRTVSLFGVAKGLREWNGSSRNDSRAGLKERNVG